jgi:threonine dehydrogenase-like Zn-dependent dehydrogenase
MRALTIDPSHPQSLELSEVPEPEPRAHELLVKPLAIGICGTDHELIGGQHGVAPAGETRLIIGHESLGEVVRAPSGSRFRPGDVVVGIVRRPDPEPCPSCGAGEWDMCQNGRYTERGIQGRHGYASDRFTLEEDFAVFLPPSLRRTGVLMEPSSVVAKAWEQIDHVSSRLHAYRPRRTLITGAGPIGLLAALMAAQRGYEVTVLDRVNEGVKPKLVRELGATYCSSLDELREEPELIVECTGVGSVVGGALKKLARNGIMCLAGLSTGKHAVQLSSSELNNALVLENEVVFGSVNANRRHYAAALLALQQAKPSWLESVISRRVPIERYREAFERGRDDVKVVLEWPA